MLISSADPSQGTCTTRVPVTCDLGSVRRRPPRHGRDPGDPARAGRDRQRSERARTDERCDQRRGRHRPGSAHLGTDHQARAAFDRSRARHRQLCNPREQHGPPIARNLRISDRLPPGLSYRARRRAPARRPSLLARRRTPPGRGRDFVLGARASSSRAPAQVTNMATVNGSNSRSRSAEATVRILPGIAAPPACVRATQRHSCAGGHNRRFARFGYRAVHVGASRVAEPIVAFPSRPRRRVRDMAGTDDLC